MKDNSNIIYGRLAEATHISGYSLERAMSEFEWLLEENRWKEVGSGYENINDFLKTLNFSEFKIAIEQRKKIAQKLKELEASQRATANTLGVGKSTIERDLDNVPNGTPNEENYTNNQIDTDVDVPNGTFKENIYTNNKDVIDDAVRNLTDGKKTDIDYKNVIDDDAENSAPPEDSLITKGKPHISYNSGDNEWYTPAEYIESARNIMGSINLDPASSDKANKIIKATNYHTVETNGLKQKWFGNIWLNPPYSQPLISHFSNKLIEELSNISQACVLTNNATETEWYQQIMSRSDAICFIKGRVKFIDMNGDATGAPLQGQTIMYFGEKANEFDIEFSKYGIICMMKKTAGQYKNNIKDKNFRNFQKVASYFDSKFFNEKEWIDCYDKLIRIEGYSEDRILAIVKEFRSDGNWWKESGNFETLLKLRRKDKEGIKFIDLFDKKLSLKNNGYSGKNTKPATKAELIGDRI